VRELLVGIPFDLGVGLIFAAVVVLLVVWRETRK
jgi:hypothetical protein